MNTTTSPHYYGNIVRTLFLIGAVIMLTTLPFFSTFLVLPAIFSIGALLAISILAGLTNPVQTYVMILNLVVSVFAIIVFEHHAVTQFVVIPTLLFMIDQVLALIFLVAVYYSTKTLRGVMVQDARSQQQSPAQPEKEDIYYRH